MNKYTFGRGTTCVQYLIQGDSFVELENSDFNEISILVSFFKCKNVSTV